MRVLSIQDGSEVNLVGHTLVLPGAGGIAHAGELAVDALVTTFGLSRTAIVQTPLLLPVAMSSAWRPAGEQQTRLELTTAAELYQSETAPKLSVLQLRSSPSEGRRRALAKELWSWASNAGVSQIVIVASCAAYIREDADLNSASRLRFAHTGLRSTDDPAPLLEKAGLNGFVLPLANSLPPSSMEDEADGENRALLAIQRTLRCGGLTRPLLYEAGEAVTASVADGKAEDSMPAAFCVLAFSSPMVDLVVLEQLAKATCALVAVQLGLQAPDMKFPPSWACQAPPPPPLLG
jgi:hypothetical protein